MNVTQDCFLKFLKSHGIEENYIDVHQIGSVTYYFGRTTLKFTNGCIPHLQVGKYLEIFGLGNSIHLLQTDECFCDW